MEIKLHCISVNSVIIQNWQTESKLLQEKKRERVAECPRMTKLHSHKNANTEKETDGFK